MRKLCVFCKNWSFDGGSPNYSELTPGWSASMSCNKGHYSGAPHFGEVNFIDLADEESYRKIILKAETCIDYDPVGGKNDE